MLNQVSARVSRLLSSILFILMLVASHVALAAPVGSAFGIVKDPTGAVVSNAHLTLKSVSTNATFITVSNSQGEFQFKNLAPDTYTLTAETPGFKKIILSDVKVQVDQDTRLDLALATGEVTEVIDVAAAAPLVETESNTIANVVDRTTIATMPLNSRNFTELALLTPGATPSAGGSQVTGFNVAGARTQSNDFLIDGISNMDTQVNGGLTSFRINDAVQEFSVQTSVPTAEFGRGQGAQINAVIRSGSNQFHGSVFDYIRNSKLNAYQYFSKHTATVANPAGKPLLIRNQFGATFGGPIFRNKTFFFFSYEGFRQKAPSSTSVLVPTPTQRASVTDPISSALLQFYPSSQQPGDMLAANGTNYTANVLNVQNDDTGLVRLDHTLTQNDRLSGHFITYNGRTFSGGGTPLSGGSSNTPLSQSVFLEENHTFSPTLLNTLRFGYSFNQTNFVVQDNGFNAQTIFTSGGITLPGVVNGTQNINASGLPTISISGGFATLGSATNLPQARKTRTYEIYDTFSAASLFGSSKHSFKAGFHVRREDARRSLDSVSRGSLSFTAVATPANGTTPAMTAAQNSFADFANGLVNSSSFRTGPTIAHYRRYPMDLFVQDQWKVLPNLTLNIGFRYELPSAIYELDNHASNLIAGQGITLFSSNKYVDIDTTKVGPSSIVLKQGTTTLSNSGQQQVDRNNIAPVLGFAWSPYKGSDATILRGGFRVGYDDIFNNIPANQSLNAPLTLVTNQQVGVTQTAKFPYATAFNQNVALVKNVGTQGPGTPTIGLLGFNAMDPYIRSAYNYSYSLSLEQKLNNRLAFEVDYIGTVGRKLGIYLDGNQPKVIVNDATQRGSAKPNEQVFPYNHYSGISVGKGAVNSNYSGLISVLKYRGAHGMQAQGSYTWSHSLDYSSAYFGSTGETGFPSDSTNLKAEYGNSAFDLRHRFVAYSSIPLPFGPGQMLFKSSNIFSRELVEGWTVSGITEYQSGLPFTVYLTGTDYSGFNQFADRPNTAAGKLVQNNKNPDCSFNNAKVTAIGCNASLPTYFTTIGAGQIGTERRNQFFGPGLVNYDLSASKNFPIFESIKLQFRADVFNLFNHTNFSNPSGSYNSSSFGKITSTVGSASSGNGNAIGGVRLAQFSLRADF